MSSDSSSYKAMVFHFEMKKNKKRSRECTKTKKKGKVCEHCQAKESTAWRRSKNGMLVCNICALYEKRHGKLKPLEKITVGGEEQESLYKQFKREEFEELQSLLFSLKESSQLDCLICEHKCE